MKRKEGDGGCVHGRDTVKEGRPGEVGKAGAFRLRVGGEHL